MKKRNYGSEDFILGLGHLLWIKQVTYSPKTCPKAKNYDVLK